MKNINLLQIVVLCLCVSACLPGQVCRHKVMSHYAVAIEEQVPTRIVVYKINSWFGEAHAQAQLYRDGQWTYIQELFGVLSENEKPEHDQTGFVIYFTGEEFLQMLRDGHYHY